MTEERSTKETEAELVTGTVAGLSRDELTKELLAVDETGDLFVGMVFRFGGEDSIVGTRVPAHVAVSLLRTNSAISSVVATIFGFAYRRLMRATYLDDSSNEETN